MPFGTATVLTNVGKAITAKRFIGTTPTQLEPKFLAIGTGATTAARTAAAADTALSTEVETRVGANAGTTVTTAVTNDTYQVIQTITATGVRAVDEAGFFDASSAGQMFISATFGVVTLQIGDSLQITGKVQYT